MSSPASNSDSTSTGFSKLDERIQRWVWSEGWTVLRDAQEAAIPALIDADRDVIIAAATAAGKTEAAFLPILTHLLRDDPDIGSVLYISPLKALINDQWGRLTALCENLDIPAIPWHGDVSSTRKHQFLKTPRGTLLITPESLEALFVNRGSSVPGIFASLRYIVVDELHAFIGSERGKQLQSLIHRVEGAVGHWIPRVGLSATLGDMKLAASFLRPNGNVEIIESKSASQDLKILVKGYEDEAPGVDDINSKNHGPEELAGGSDIAIADHLYRVLLGTNNLVFPNRRARVELLADLLRRRCEREGVPNEFWPHHGSLSKDIREETEQALKKGDRPATAICTTTLELGIDIGSIASIAQIGPPPSVASLRQRLGRSGRREGEPAILRAYCVEPSLTAKSCLSDRLHESLVQTVAMIQLLLAGWFEPPRVGGLHASTLVQQLLSTIAERGGITASEAWSLLIKGGPFANIEKDDFLDLLRNLGSLELVIQDASGLLLHGPIGERLVNHYEFFSAFMGEEEFRLISDGKALGSLPISHPLTVGQRIIFAGRRWQVVDVQSERKTISVVPHAGGAPPSFGGGAGMVHDMVRLQMRKLLASADDISFLDSRGKALLEEARASYSDAHLANRDVVSEGSDILLMTWRGDWVNDALTLLLNDKGFKATNEGMAVSVLGKDSAPLLDALEEMGNEMGTNTETLLANAKNIQREKWDWALPSRLLRRSYASSALDLTGALSEARRLARANAVSGTT